MGDRGRRVGGIKEHGWCFAALSSLIDESGPRGALKANRYSFFSTPSFFFLTVCFVADSGKM